MEPAELAQKLVGKTVDTLNESEWRKLLLETIKQDNSSYLIPLLKVLPDAFKTICVVAVDGSNLLEFAILNSYWNSANVLVRFECGADLTPVNANEDLWAKAIHNILKRYLKTREIRSLHNEQYQAILKERMKAYFEAYKNGCVSLFASINYPKTFVLLTRLGANIYQKDDKKNTVVYLLIDSKNITSGIKLQLLRYIKQVDNDLLFEPSGSDSIPPAFYCYQNNCRKFIKEINPPFEELLKLRTASGKEFADLINLRYIAKLLTSEQLLTLFLHDKSLDVLLKRAEKKRGTFKHPEIAHALEIMVAQGRPVPDIVKQPHYTFLCAYAKELGLENVQLGHLERFYGKGSKVEAAKKRFERSNTSKVNHIGRFPIDQLPTDILALFAAHLSVQDVMAIFSVSKTLREKYRSNSAPLLWRNVAKNTLNKVKYDTYDHSGANEWKKMVHSNSRMASNWIAGKYTERTLFSESYAWGVTLSEDWACWNIGYGVKFWNCDTDEQKFLPCSNYQGACFVGSSYNSARDPILAAHVLEDDSSKLNLISPSGILGSISLPRANVSRHTMLLDKNHVVTGDYLALADIHQQKMIKILPEKTAYVHTINNYSASPTIIGFSRSFKEIQLFDRDLKQVQTIESPWYHDIFTRIYAVNEHRLIVTRNDGFVAFDTRYTKQSDVYNLSVKFPHRDYVQPWNTSVTQAVDVANNRLLMDAWEYGITMLWDLNTLTWNAVRRNNVFPRALHMAINSRYHLMIDTLGPIKAHDYA